MELKVNQISALDLFHIARSDFNILRLEIHISLYLEAIIFFISCYMLYLAMRNNFRSLSNFFWRMQKYLSITITINRLWDQLPPKPKPIFYLFLHNSPHGYSISYYGNRMWTISNGNAANNSIFSSNFPYLGSTSNRNQIIY